MKNLLNSARSFLTKTVRRFPKMITVGCDNVQGA